MPLFLALAWPCLAAVFGLIALIVFRPNWGAWDDFALAVLLVSLPAPLFTVRSCYHSFPARWPDPLRTAGAVAAGIPGSGCSLYAAALLFCYGSFRLGYFG